MSFVKLRVFANGCPSGGLGNRADVIVNTDLIRTVCDGQCGGYRATIIEWVDQRKTPLFSPMSPTEVMEALNR